MPDGPWNYNTPTATQLTDGNSITHCSVGGAKVERVHSCMGKSSSYPLNCDQYFTEESAAFGSEGGYHRCKPKGGAFGWDWAPVPPWGKCDASTTRCKPASPCKSGLSLGDQKQCVNILDLNIDPRYYFEISYTIDGDSRTVAGHFKSHNNDVRDYTYQPTDVIGQIMGHLYDNLGIVSIRCVNTEITDNGEKFASTLTINLTSGHNRDLRFWDESGDFYDAQTMFGVSDTKRNFDYSSKNPRLEYVANKGFSV